MGETNIRRCVGSLFAVAANGVMDGKRIAVFGTLLFGFGSKFFQSGIGTIADGRATCFSVYDVYCSERNVQTFLTGIPAWGPIFGVGPGQSRASA